MNQASLWRYDIAKQIAPLYANNPHVAAVILGGSTARGHADRYSDIEIGVFWHQDPSYQERESVVKSANADLMYLYDYDPDEQIWSDDFMMGRDATNQPKTGILVEVCHYRKDFTEQILHQVLHKYSTRELSHNLISGIVDALPLHDEELIAAWKNQAADYPRALSDAVVQRYGIIDHFWRWEVYLARGKNLRLIYQSFAQIHHQLLHILLGLNGVYYFGFKWIEVVDARLKIKPVDLLSRMRETYTSPPDIGAKLVTELVEDVFSLVEVHLPEVDINRLRGFFHYRRPFWDDSPLNR